MQIFDQMTAALMWESAARQKDVLCRTRFSFPLHTVYSHSVFQQVPVGTDAVGNLKHYIYYIAITFRIFISNIH